MLDGSGWKVRILLPFHGVSGLLFRMVFSCGLSSTVASSGPKKAQTKLQDFLRLRPRGGIAAFFYTFFVKSHRPAQTPRGRGLHNSVNIRGQGFLGVSFGDCCPTEKKQS